MYWILLVMGVLVAVVAALLVGGLATPRAHVATASVIVPQPIDAVWAVVREVRRYAEWRPQVLASHGETGDDGEEWTERGRRRSIRFGVIASEPPTHFGARILDDDSPFTGEWHWTLESVGAGTRVTLTERGEVGNPIFRFIAAQMVGYDRSINEYAAALVVRCAGAR